MGFKGIQQYAEVCCQTGDGKPAILLYDVDSDGQVCAYLYKEEIISQKKEVIFLLLLILAAIIALIILVTAWYWLIHRKSWTTKHGEVAIVVNNVPKPNRSSFPKRGKADVPLSYLKIAEVGTGELNTQLSAYTRMFKLRAGSNARVYVMREKSKNTVFSMNIGQKPMNKNSSDASIDIADYFEEHANSVMGMTFRVARS